MFGLRHLGVNGGQGTEEEFCTKSLCSSISEQPSGDYETGDYEMQEILPEMQEICLM